MESYEQITQAVYDAIDEVNEMREPDEAIEKSPDTVLIGESGKLDSLGLVNLAVAVEKNIERGFKETISVMDLVPTAEESAWTVAGLAKSIAERVGRAGSE